MSRGASGTRICSQCGYVFAPLETDCPKCAHLAAAHAAVRDPRREEADRQQRGWATYRERLRRARVRRQVVVAILSLVGGAIVGFPVAIFIALLGETVGEEPAVVLLCCVLVAIGAAVLIYLIINRFFPYTPDEPMVLYDGPKYTKSDRAKYLVVAGAGLVGISLILALNLHQIAVFVFVALFWLGIVGLILIYVLIRFFFP